MCALGRRVDPVGPNFASQYALGSQSRSPNFGIAHPGRYITPIQTPTLGPGAFAGLGSGFSSHPTNSIDPTNSLGNKGPNINHEALNKAEDISDEFLEDNPSELDSSLEDIEKEIEEAKKLEEITKKELEELDNKIKKEKKENNQKEVERLEKKKKELEKKQEDHQKSIEETLQKLADATPDPNDTGKTLLEADKEARKKALNSVPEEQQEELQKDLSRLSRASATKRQSYAEELGTSSGIEEQDKAVQDSIDDAQARIERNPSEIKESIKTHAEANNLNSAVTAQKEQLEQALTDPKVPSEKKAEYQARLDELKRREKDYLDHQQSTVAEIAKHTGLNVSELKQKLSSGNIGDLVEIENTIDNELDSNDAKTRISAETREMMVYLKEYIKAIRKEAELQKPIYPNQRQVTDLGVSTERLNNPDPLSTMFS